jgi:alkaline phosphatase D
MLEFFGSGRTSNPVVLTGDRHATWVCDLKPDFDDPGSPVVGAEITGTSISSGGDSNPVTFHQTFDPIMADSPHWKYIDNRRGYVLCEVTPERMLASLRTVDTVRQQAGTTVTTAAEFVVENGRPGVELNGTPREARAMRLSGLHYDVDDDQF